MTATVTEPSFCRLCTALCPIVVTIEDGRAVEVHGDREAPLFGGYTCPKGRALPEMHASPERLLHSLKQRPDGSHEPIASDQMVAEVAERLAAIVDRYGPDAVATYTGTSNIAYPTMGGMASALLRALGSKMFFSAATIDQPGVTVADAVHGVWLGGRHRFGEADAWLFVGTNPVISKQYLAENPAQQLHHAVERGLQLVVIDPRRSETARLARVHLQPRPNEDAALLAAMLHVLLRDGLVDDAFVRENVDGFERLRAAVEPFTPEYAASRADVPVPDLLEAARILGTATRGGTGGGTGVSMSGGGSLVSYLLLCINSVRGFWAREGDRVERPNVLLPPNRARAQAFPPIPAWGFGQQLRTRGLGQTVAGLPTGALAEEILTPGPGQIRALLNVGGSPMMAWPDQRRTQEALADLDLFVTTDVWYSPTARAAHYVAATRMTFETPGMTQVSEAIKYGHIGYGFSEPYAQYTSALLDPPHGSDLIEDWQLFYRVGRQLGLSMKWTNVFGSARGHLEAPIEQIPLDMDREPTTDELFAIMCRGSNVPLDEVKRHRHGHVYEQHQRQTVAARDADCDARLDVGNDDLLAELDRIIARDRVAAVGITADHPFLLIGRRENRVINSTGRNLPGLMRGRTYNPAFMHPDDLAGLAVAPGDLVEIRSPYGAVRGVVHADRDLRHGIVSMSHGFGRNPGEPEDPRVDGANTNRLLRTDIDFDPITGMPRMGAVPVSVAAVAPRAARYATKPMLSEGLSLQESGGMVIVPGARYTSREFFDLEMERLWPRVWQVACREEEIPNPGDFLEYTIGDQSILVVREDAGTITAFFNACTHRGTRLAAGTGNFATAQIRCPYHAWRWGLSGDIIEVVDRHDFPATMTDADVHLGEVQVGRWGGFVFVNMDPGCESFDSFMGDMPEQYATYRFENLRFRSYRTIVFAANWKTCVDSFQEGYHPQGLHPQMLTWFDDTRMVYRQVGRHSRYDAPRRREMGPSPRLGLGPDDYDEQELLADRVDAMAGLFTRKDQKLLEELKTNGPPPGKTALEVFDDLRINAMRDRGYDLSGLDPDDILSNGTMHLFPNLLGPIAYGNATLYRARPNGLDPDSTILDYWALEWLPDGAEAPPVERKFYDDWTAKNWGLINNQDFANFTEATKGMKSRGYQGARLNPVQEANIIHHNRVIDSYLLD